MRFVLGFLVLCFIANSAEARGPRKYTYTTATPTYANT